TGGGQLDLEDNKLFVTTAGALGSLVSGTYTGITGLVASGRNGGGAGTRWAGSGIITSMAGAVTTGLTTLAAAKVGDVKGVADSGQIVHGSDTVVTYTYAGDANVDGKIDITDYGRIDFNIALHVAGYCNGDFNYDGKIDISDYGIIDFDLPIQGPQLSP